MKNELHYYVMSLADKELFNIPNSCLWLILSMFLIPILIYETWIGLVIILSYTILYSYAKKQVSKYYSTLLTLGHFLMFLGVECSILILFQYAVAIHLIITAFLLMLSYEIIWIIKLSFRMYSKNTKQKSLWGHAITLLCGGTGVWCGKLLAKSKNTDLKLWIVIILCSFLFASSISFIQKYFVAKILNK